MIIYISTYSLKDILADAVLESGMNVFDSLIAEDLNFKEYFKQNMDRLRNINCLLIVLDALSDSDSEIIDSFKSLRMVFPDIRLVTVSLSRRTGDFLLSEIFSLGIYDIILPDLDNVYQMKQDIKKTVLTGMTFKDSIHFKDYKVQDAPEAKKNERIIIQNKIEIRTTASRALIGFIGASRCIGVTSSLILCASFLTANGYRVAAVENMYHKRKCFDVIKDDFDDVQAYDDGCFCINKIDYYPSYDISGVHKVLNKNYNFVLLDFGAYEGREHIKEFDRCMMQIVVSGIKPWEVGCINRIFSDYEDDELKNFFYLFNFADKRHFNDIRENMGEINKVFFTEYVPDPFNGFFYKELYKLFKDYVTEDYKNEKKKGLSMFVPFIHKK